MSAQPEIPLPHDWLLPHRLVDGAYVCPDDCPALHGGLRPEAPGDGVHAIVACTRCGGDVEITIGDHRYAMRVGAPIVHGRGQCVGDEAPEAPPVRRFEARVQVVEIFADGREELMTTLTAKAEAATFKAAVDDPLSGSLQEQWLKMCGSAHLADMG